MAGVTLSGLAKSFGEIHAVRDVSLEIADREFVVFVGPSGCGKSTLLRMIAGLEEITSGSLRIGGREMKDVPAADRGIAMVFQSYALYPHMNVRENIGFGLRMAGTGKAEVAAKVAEAAAVLRIEDLLDRRPRELSGGQRQRVAIGRAIVKSPGVFLFDEPLSNLDADLRTQMRVEIARLHEALNATIIYVTHDQVEAMTLADRIVVLRDGRIEQQGTPEDLYDRPANLFVAGFIGQPRINLLDAILRLSGGTAHVDVPPFGPLPAPAALASVGDGSALTVGLRPDALSLDPGDGHAVTGGRVELVENLGNEVVVHLRLPGIDKTVVATTPRSYAPAPVPKSRRASIRPRCTSSPPTAGASPPPSPPQARREALRDRATGRPRPQKRSRHPSALRPGLLNRVPRCATESACPVWHPAQSSSTLNPDCPCASE